MGARSVKSPAPTPTFLEAALGLAPLQRGEDSWAFLRYCDVLPADAKSDFNFVRAHETSRGEKNGPALAARIALSLADRATPKGRTPDPKSVRAKALWQAFEANNFKAPQYVPRWPNHSGTPTKETDTFPPVPSEIGEVLSATTNVHDGRVERDHLASIFFGILIGGAPGALLGFIATQLADWPAVPFTTGSTVVATLIAYAVHAARNSRHYATWVGTEGLATTTDGKVLVFRFERAVRLDRTLSDQVSNGEVIGKRAEYTWLNSKNRIVHRARAVLPDDPSSLPETAAAHFVRAAEAAWKAFEDSDRR
ncbi:MAG: hypothetical protein H6Q89_3921 [Myxococcaceae bacterium]|nr:hypothetical protein [Myxococcaceae bacterium]